MEPATLIAQALEKLKEYQSGYVCEYFALKEIEKILERALDELLKEKI